MNSNWKVIEPLYERRRKKFLQLIKGDVAIIASTPEFPKNRDQHHSFVQNSDLEYLTGFKEPESALILNATSNEQPKSILFLREREELAERWLGERLGTKRAKKYFKVSEIRDVKTLKPELAKILSGANRLHYALGINPEIDAQVCALFKTTVGPRLLFPHSIIDSRLITSEMRFVKDSFEINALKQAAEISARGFRDLLPKIKHLSSEIEVARVLESLFAMHGGLGTAFSTIVASGNNATTLHHVPSSRKPRTGELVLIDAGATYLGYAGDITRTVPVSGKFSDSQAAVYDVVLSARDAAISCARPGVNLEDIHKQAVKEIVAGLIDLKILKGKASTIIAKGTYKRFFMHRTGHWLGLDVHDISPVLVKNNFTPAIYRRLVPGNVFTVEPGIYLDAKDKTLPKKFRGIGIRIEDDILITSSGRQVLTKSIPASREEIESLMEK